MATPTRTETSRPGDADLVRGCSRRHRRASVGLRRAGWWYRRALSGSCWPRARKTSRQRRKATASRQIRSSSQGTVFSRSMNGSLTYQKSTCRPPARNVHQSGQRVLDHDDRGVEQHVRRRGRSNPPAAPAGCEWKVGRYLSSTSPRKASLNSAATRRDAPGRRPDPAQRELVGPAGEGRGPGHPVGDRLTLAPQLGQREHLRSEDQRGHGQPDDRLADHRPQDRPDLAGHERGDAVEDARGAGRG